VCGDYKDTDEVKKQEFVELQDGTQKRMTSGTIENSVCKRLWMFFFFIELNILALLI